MTKEPAGKYHFPFIRLCGMYTIDISRIDYYRVYDDEYNGHNSFLLIYFQGGNHLELRPYCVCGIPLSSYESCYLEVTPLRIINKTLYSEITDYCGLQVEHSIEPTSILYKNVLHWFKGEIERFEDILQRYMKHKERTSAFHHSPPSV